MIMNKFTLKYSGALVVASLMMGFAIKYVVPNHGAIASNACGCNDMRPNYSSEVDWDNPPCVATYYQKFADRENIYGD